MLCTFATLMFYVLYLVVVDMGAEGYLLAIICGDAASSLFLFITGTLWRYIDFSRINRTLWREMLRFSLPMIPAQISFWIINASDMFFVNALCEGYGGRSGTEWSGLLSTGYFLPTILTTLAPSFTTPGSCPPSPRSTAAAGFTPTCSRATPASCSAAPAASCGSAARSC